MSSIVIYDRHSADSVASAWISSLNESDISEYVDCGVRYKASKLQGYNTVWIIDFEVSQTDLITVCAHNRFVNLITSKPSIILNMKDWRAKPINLEITQDIKSSTVELALFKFKVRSFDLIDYIADIKRQYFSLPSSDLVYHVIENSRPFTFEKFERLQDDLLNSPRQILFAGLMLKDEMNRLIGYQTSKKMYAVLKNTNIKISNCTIYVNESCLKMAEESQSGIAMVWRSSGGSFIFSVRATYKSDIGADEIAQLFGGGGNKRAAGFTCNYKQMESIINSIHHEQGRQI